MRGRLERKIISVAAILLFLSFTVMSMATFPWLSHYIKKDQTDRMHELANDLVRHLKEEMLREHPLYVEPLLRSYNLFRSVDTLDVLRTSGESAFKDYQTLNKVNQRLGKVIFQREGRPVERVLSPDDPALKKVLETRAAYSFSSPDEKYITLLLPLLAEPACQKCHDPKNEIRGVVMVKMSTAENRRYLHSLMVALVGGSLILLLIIALLLWAVLRKMVTSPITRIADNMRSLTEKGFGKDEVTVSSNDEIGDLASNFNQMRKTLKDNYQKLKDAEDFLHTVIDSTGEGILVVDKEYRILMANRYILNWTGKKADNVLGEFCYRLIHNKNESCSDCATTKTLITGKPDFTHRRVTKQDGSIINIELSAYPIFGGENEVIQVIEKVVDISDKLKLEKQLQQSEKLAAVGVLASGVAHEVGNPLASISSLAQLIERKTKDEAVREKIGLMKGEVDRISRIIRNFLDFSKPGSGKLEKLDMQPILESTINLTRYDKRVKNLNIKVDYGKDLPKTFASRESLHQVFMNLLLNAGDAIKGKDNGIIEISVDSENGFLSVNFKDNGKGMSKEEQTKIFDPFFTTKERGEGMGLGLFMSYGIIKNLGGGIDVESHEGVGSSFVVLLPTVS